MFGQNTEKSYDDKKRQIEHIETARLIVEEVDGGIHHKIPHKQLCKYTCPDCGHQILTHILAEMNQVNEQICVDCMEEMQREYFDPEEEDREEANEGGNL